MVERYFLEGDDSNRYKKAEIRHKKGSCLLLKLFLRKASQNILPRGGTKPTETIPRIPTIIGYPNNIALQSGPPCRVNIKETPAYSNSKQNPFL